MAVQFKQENGPEEGERLKAFIKARGETYESFAEKMDTTITTVKTCLKEGVKKWPFVYRMYVLWPESLEEVFIPTLHEHYMSNAQRTNMQTEMKKLQSDFLEVLSEMKDIKRQLNG